MQRAKLTDDELWRTIAQNTDEFSAFLRVIDADVRIGDTSRARSRSYAEAVTYFECEYRDCILELRHRHLRLEKNDGSQSRTQVVSQRTPLDKKTIMARLATTVTFATFISYIVAVLVSVVMVGAFH